MATAVSIFRSAASALARGAIGFGSGLLVAWFALMFLGFLHGHSDLDRDGLAREAHGRLLAIYIASGVAVIAVFAGKVRVSESWVRFTIAFGVICLIPIWPPKAGMLPLLPLGTPYVNLGFHPLNIILLTIHVTLAFGWAVWVHRRRKIA